jgi:hypothetical protein
MISELACEKQANMTASLLSEYQPAQGGTGEGLLRQIWENITPHFLA